MKQNSNSATCSKTRSLGNVMKEDYTSQLETMTQDEKLASALNLIQRVYGKDGLFLMREDSDWLVVMQCLQDNGLFLKHTQRMPLTAFIKKLEALGVPQLWIHYSMRSMSYTNAKINGLRYPWEGCFMPNGIIKRWQELYRLVRWVLVKMTLCQ